MQTSARMQASGRQPMESDGTHLTSGPAMLG